MGAIGELQVVDLVGVLVGDLDDELVTGGDADGARVVLHALGSDADCRGVAGGGDLPDHRGRAVGVIGGCVLVQTVTNGGCVGFGGCGGCRLGSRGDGCPLGGGPRGFPPLGRGGRPSRHLASLLLEQGDAGAHHRCGGRQEGGQSDDGHHHAEATSPGAHGEHPQQQPGIGDGGSQRAEGVHFGIGRPDDLRPAIHDHRHEIAHGADEELEQETDDDGHREGEDVVSQQPGALGSEFPGQPDEPHQHPADGRPR